MQSDSRTTVVVPLPDGRFAALDAAALDAAIGRAAKMGYGREILGAAPMEEPLRNSKQEALLLGIGDVTLEVMAKRGEVPCIRIGKALRFRHTDVIAALQRKK